MGRIKDKEFDGNITGQDFLLGSDGDTTNSITKNYLMQDVADFVIDQIPPSSGGQGPFSIDPATGTINALWSDADPSLFGRAGNNAINFSTTTSIDGSEGYGATGLNSVAFGINNIASGENSVAMGEEVEVSGTASIAHGFGLKLRHGYSLMIGFNQETEPTTTNNGGNFFMGLPFSVVNFRNRIYDNVFSTFVLGDGNTVGTIGAVTGTDASMYKSMIAGTLNNVPAAYNGFYFGSALEGSGSRVLTTGVANIDLTQTSANGVTATSQAYNPRFIVGVGDWNHDSNTGTRANGLVVMSDGVVSAPSLSISDIDSPTVPVGASAEFANRILITKEYADANYSGGGGGQVDSVVGTANEIDVDSTDPVNPIVSLSTAVTDSLALADSALQGSGTDTQVGVFDTNGDLIGDVELISTSQALEAIGGKRYSVRATSTNQLILDSYNAGNNLRFFIQHDTLGANVGVDAGLWLDLTAASGYVRVGSVTGARLYIDNAGSPSVEFQELEISDIDAGRPKSAVTKEWVQANAGGGAVDSVNGQTGVVVLDADDIDDSSTTNKYTTQADITRLANTSGTNTGDEDTASIQSKRPLKTVNGETLEGSGDVVIPTPLEEEIVGTVVEGSVSGNTPVDTSNGAYFIYNMTGNTDFVFSFNNFTGVSQTIVFQMELSGDFAYTFEPVNAFKELAGDTYNGTGRNLFTFTVRINAAAQIEAFFQIQNIPA